MNNNRLLIMHTAIEDTSSNLSSIVPSDRELLSQTVHKFRPRSKNYEDSWGYVIQATRYGGFKWYDKKTGALIFFGRKSDIDPSLVVPSFFATPKYLASAIKKVQEALHAPQTVLKNVDPEDVKKFQDYGFRPYHKKEKWSDLARFDDQTFPQQIVDLQKVTELKGKEYHHLRKALRKDPNATLRKYKKTDRKGVLSLFSFRDGNPLLGLKKEKGMYYVSHAMYPSAKLDKYVLINKETGHIIGFTAISEITKQTGAFVALIFNPGIKIASVWAIFQTLAASYNKGFKAISFGGSETEGTDTFVKRTFQPVEKIERTHLVYDQDIEG
jgi:hypothetical protein